MPPIQELTLTVALLLLVRLSHVVRFLPQAVPAAAVAPAGVRGPIKTA